MPTSARIQEFLLDFLSDGVPHTVQEMKSRLDQSECVGYTEGQFAGSLNTLMRNKSIEKLDRALYVLCKDKEGASAMRKCFIVSPIGDEGTSIRDNADKLFRYILTPVCQNCGFEAVRVDQMNDSGSITQTILDQLVSADLVIADLSDHNPNVFYEMGYRKCTGKPIIHLKKKGESIPFDVTTIRTFEYDLTDLDSVEEIKTRLQRTIQAFSFTDDSPETPGDSQNLSGILPALYQIQDSIDQLKAQIEKKDTETLQALMQTSLNNAAKQESAEAVMMKLILPELVKNPKIMQNLMELSAIAKNSKQ